MHDSQSFEQMMRRLRLGDAQAAADLVQQYESEVRRFVRFRLSTPQIRRFVDSLDICQSVLARFFVELEKGTVDVCSADQLRNLLLTMARNRIYDHARQQQAAKRDVRRLQDNATGNLDQVVDSAQTPSSQLAADELLAAIRAELSPEEQYLIDERLGGRSWEELADELHMKPDAARKRMTRAIDRVAQLLGVIES